MLQDASIQIRHLPVSDLVEFLLKEALRQHSSDIHLDPAEESFRIRFRIDGLLEEKYILPKELGPPIIFRLKVLAEVRTDEHQAAQDGRFFFQSDKERINIRLSLIPTYYGTNAVLRLLRKSHQGSTLEDLGFNQNHCTLLRHIVKKNSGMILITGPTGSGKTTTPYTLLELLKEKPTSMVSIEDPIEYAVENVVQIPVNSYSLFNFSNALRSVLRQDPDIIMIGEIRDRETARLAFGSSMTGHLILSSLHTNSALLTLNRLLDLGIEPYAIASSLSMVISQRLVRRSCSECGAKNHLPKKKNCLVCRGSGFSGRLVIAEVLEIDNYLRDLIRNSQWTNLSKLTEEGKFLTLREDGYQKVDKLQTSMTEVLRVTYEEA